MTQDMNAYRVMSGDLHYVRAESAAAAVDVFGAWYNGGDCPNGCEIDVRTVCDCVTNGEGLTMCLDADDSDAQKYARGIADDIEAVEWLDGLEWDDDNYLYEKGDTFQGYQLTDMSAEDFRALAIERGLSQAVARSVFDIVASYSGEEYSFSAAFMDQRALDIEVVHGADGTLRGVNLLVTFGGPNCWVKVTGSDFVRVEVSWWGDSGAVSVDAPRFAGHVLDIEVG